MSDTIILDSKKCNAELLTIHADGRITVAEHLKPTETAAAVLQIMREQWMDSIQSKKIREQEDRIKRLEDRIAKQNTEIEQTCGKVLDYPWYKNDQKNFPGSTEVDGVCVGEHIAETIASELARKYTGLEKRIKRLEEAGDAMLNAWLMPEDSMEYCDWVALSADAKAMWHKAKDAKP